MPSSTFRRHSHRPGPALPTPPTVVGVFTPGAAIDVDAAVICDDTCYACLHESDLPLQQMQSSIVGETLPASPASAGPIPIPRNPDEAVNDPVYGKRWLEAMKNDIAGKHLTNKAWELVKTIPKGRKVMKGKWVFTVIYNADGSVKKFKARWVGCGYSQIAGVDYVETNCTTLAIPSYRLFTCATACNDDECIEADVVKAFSCADMDGTELYVEQPPYFIDPTMAACKLLRPLEGTKQAGYLYQQTCSKLMCKLGFTRSVVDPNIYWLAHDAYVIRVGIYVDNLLVAFPKNNTAAKRRVDDFLAKFNDRLPLELRGEPAQFMGVQIERDRKAKTIKLHQQSYIKQMAARFLTGSTKSFSTPVHSSKLDEFMKIDIAQTDEEQSIMRTRPYLSLMGSLLWVTFTRPDVSYYVARLCCVMHKPSIAAYDAALGVLSYLNETSALGLTYDGNRPEFHVFSDSSYKQSPMPFAGYTIICGNANVANSARKLKITPLSSAEAENAVYAMACKEWNYVRQLWGADGFQMKIKGGLPVNIYCDNSAACTTIKTPGLTQRTKHYESWVHYSRRSPSV